ncbi:hypothetical protein [Phyllobacterium endophyticum]|uniref:hypothetical protein n=1 Tax=Phyllobacterium endophyticum TaxID=1149773 RepID=UPI0011C7A63B|nr:hypothetical protein [Phyllobacterium endophyticum]TXR50087.1 hypothetical protein FVA77_06800 [Phyllobacterium endophyticum]
MPLDKETAQYMLELSEEIDRLWRYIGYDKEAKEARARARDIEDKVAGYKKEAEDLFRRQYEEASKYFNTVMAIGYAGYFATWTLMRSDIDKWHGSLIGLMGMLSLATFICWELFAMRMRMNGLAEINTFFRNMISVDDFEPLRQEQLSKEAQRMMWARPTWALAFFFSVSTATIGAIDLMIQLSKNF